MINIVGIGPGEPGYMTPQAVSALKGAAVIVGGRRVLDSVRANSEARLVELPPDGMAGAVVDILREESRAGDITLAVSGDPGFYSLAKRVIENFGAGAVNVIPGISCAQIMAARLGKSWAEASSSTVHGRTRPDIASFAAKLKASAALVVLLGEAEKVAEDIEWLASDEYIGGAWAALGWDLGLPGERITEARTLREIDAGTRGGKLAILWLEKNGEHRAESRFPMTRGTIPDEWFERTDGVPMTKAFSRSVAISLLSPLHGSRILEIGSGTGAMTVELARAAGETGVVSSVELSDEALSVTKKNLMRAGLSGRVNLIEGAAPEAVPAARFDAAFVGGHGKRIEDVLSAVWNVLEPGGRMLLTSITPSAASKSLEYIGTLTPSAGIWRAHSSYGRRLGSDWLMTGNNPVDFIWGDK